MGIGRDIIDEARHPRVGEKVELDPKSRDASYFAEKGMKSGVLSTAPGKGLTPPFCDKGRNTVAVDWGKKGTKCVPLDVIRKVG